jgi:type VI secretion system protein ImpF
MARQRSEPVPLLSVLDRLLDDDPGATHEVPATAAQRLRELKHGVRRDLEDLLNTRLSPLDLPPHLREVRQSLAAYGLRDFASITLGSVREQQAFCEEIRKVILQFEPRLKNVQVTPTGTAEPLDRTFRFRIEALLKVEPAPEPVAFDSRVEPATGDVHVAEVSG